MSYIVKYVRHVPQVLGREHGVEHLALSAMLAARGRENARPDKHLRLADMSGLSAMKEMGTYP